MTFPQYRIKYHISCILSRNTSYIALFFLVYALSACASVNNSQKTSPHKTDVKPLLGKLTWADWKKNAGWESYAAVNFAPNPAFVQRIEEDVHSFDFSFIVFAGNWCEDSRSELPKFYQLLEMANIPASKVTMYGLDENKNDITRNAEKFGIYKVPTIIVVRNGIENGRIAEKPHTSWDLDLIIVMER